MNQCFQSCLNMLLSCAILIHAVVCQETNNQVLHLIMIQEILI
jgi:hypothetical protein